MCKFYVVACFGMDSCLLFCFI